MIDSTPPCKLLDWDSDFFQRRIARITDTALTGGRLEQVDAWSRHHAIDCLYYLADSGDRDSIRLAEENGFRMVEVRMIFERSLQTWLEEGRTSLAPQITLRPSTPDDIPALQEIAKNSYVNSRYYFDPHFGVDQWQEFYQYWIKKSVLGGADLALTAEQGGEILGYITGLIDQETNEGIYELTGVKTSARRAGIGQELYRCGVDWFAHQGVPMLSVTTQGRNITTQRMIQRFGFLTRSCQLYYHKWYTE